MDQCAYPKNFTLNLFPRSSTNNFTSRQGDEQVDRAHWSISNRTSQMKDHSISVDQARYSTSVVDKYLYTATVKTSTNFYKTNLSSDMIFIKYYASTSDDQVEKFTREFNIRYRACIGSLIYFLSTILDFSFAVHN